MASFGGFGGACVGDGLRVGDGSASGDGRDAAPNVVGDADGTGSGRNAPPTAQTPQVTSRDAPMTPAIIAAFFVRSGFLRVGGCGYWP
jgi:hypothetical protein